MATALIRGIGDVGSAVALTLLKAGHRVVLIDTPQPAYCRRATSFTDAAYDGTKLLDGVLGKVCAHAKDLPRMIANQETIPIVLSEDLPPDVSTCFDVLVDARMRKRATPEIQLGVTRLTIGVGPNFEAGTHTDIVIESAWGEELGRIIERGASRPFTGIPREICGYSQERYIYAPNEGLFDTAYEIGAWAHAGEPIGDIDGRSVRASINGWIRGITRRGIKVRAGTKLVDLDPSAMPSDPSLIGQRPARIARSVTSVVQSAANSGENGRVGPCIRLPPDRHLKLAS